METAKILTIASVVIAILLLYGSWDYYIDRSLERACADSQIYLEGASEGILLIQTNTMAERLGTDGVDDMEGARHKIVELRRLATSEGDLADISMLETGHLILSDIEGECDFFRNIIKVGQERSLMEYTIAFKQFEGDLAGEIEGVEDSVNRIEHVKAVDKCGLASEENPILKDREPEYCGALNELNYDLIKGLEKSMEDSEDGTSRTYKAILINCYAECINEEIDCVDNCWIEKLL